MKPHPFLERQGDNLYSEMLIPFGVAALGGEVAVPTLEGKIKLRVPAGTPSGKIFRIKEKGMPSLHGVGRGSQLMRVEIEVPAQLSERERAILTEWAKERQDLGASPKKKSFLDRFRDSL